MTLITLPIWTKYCEELCHENTDYLIGNILKMNETPLDMDYFVRFFNKTCILINPDCDFPPPKQDNTYEFDSKYKGLTNDCNEKTYKDKRDMRILRVIEEYNIQIICYSSSIYHKNVKCIPLGISWQVNINNSIFMPTQKDILCYANFGIPTLSRWFGNPRLDTFNILDKNPFITIENTQLDTSTRKQNNDYNNYFNKLKHSHFAICPRGCGIDSYRVYDAIICKCIPIMLKNEENYLHFNNLPILFVDDYNCITEEFLKDSIVKFDLSKEYDELLINYWIEYTKCGNDRSSNSYG